MSKLQINKTKLLRRTILALLLLGCIGTYVVHRYVQKFGFNGIGEFISVYRHNVALAETVEPLELQLLLSDADYGYLSNRRDIALERGIQINDGEDTYVDCKIVSGNDTVKGEIRLKGHMTDHLQGEKWSFRVKTKKNKQVLGMSRFSLQAPGTRNYAYEWVYHQLLKQEGIIYLNYDFIRLKLNEKDLGIYAIEEHFGQHVLEHNDRPKGAILRWNPNLYWDGRIDEFQGTYLDEQYSDYASSFAEPFEDGVVKDDPELVATYQQGAALLEAFRRGEKKTSEVFDVLMMARFHAIIDLVGGHHSLDWSDVKFFYNSTTGKIEPVGYESFSVRKTESIAGQRLPDEYDDPGFNYHNQLFSDPSFFAVYIQELERIADEAYLDGFMNLIQAELDQKLGVLAHEFPYRKFTFDPYFENISLIRHNLELPKAFHAFKEEQTDSTVRLSITPVSDFPVEILSLVVDGKEEFGTDTVFILPAKARNTYAHYFDLVIHHDAGKLKKLTLKARIPGSNHIFEIEVMDLPSYNCFTATKTVTGGNYEADHGGLTALNDSVSFFNRREVVISQPLTFNDTSHTLIFLPGQVVAFEPNGQIITNGRIEMIGNDAEGEQIFVKSTLYGLAENSPGYIPGHIVIDGGAMVCDQVNFVGAENFLYCNSGQVNFRHCVFADIESTFIMGFQSKLMFQHCASGLVDSLGKFDRCLVRMKDFVANNGTVFLAAYGSDVNALDCSVYGYQKIAVLKNASSLEAWSSAFSALSVIAELDEASDFKTYGGQVSDAKVGFRVDNETVLPGISGYVLYKTTTERIGTLEERKSL